MIGYKHLLGYLERYTLIHFKRMHIRIHRIKRPDITPFLHTHPFHYLSIVLRGGYTESLEGKMIKHRWLSVIPRRSKTAHRIVAVQPGTLTLFFSWKTKGQQWEFKRGGSDFPSQDWVDHPKGIYTRELYGRIVFSKFDGYWHRAADSKSGAEQEYRPSIDQSTPGVLVSSLLKTPYRFGSD